MTISTVLSTIQSLLEANPIVNEPTHEHRTLTDADGKASDYAELVQFRLIAHTLRGLQAWKRGAPIPEHRGFEDVLTEHSDAYIERLMKIIERKAAEGDKMYKGVFYCMEGLASWSGLLERARLLKAELKLRD
jgi:phage terminase Nu1 subunit (DNA packaging protein)